MGVTDFYLLLSALLFTIGTLGVLIRRNTIIVLMSIELMLNAVNISLVTFSRLHEVLDGQVFVIFVMAVAAAEVAVGLAIVILVFKNFISAEVDEPNLLRG